MAFLAVDKNGQQVIFINKPKRDKEGYWYDPIYMCGSFSHFSNIQLPKGSIEKLTGRKLTWNNNPLKLKENETV